MFSQSADGFGRQTKLYAINAFGLNIDRKGAARLDVGVAAIIAGLGAATGQLTYSAHKSLIWLLGNTRESIIDEQEWQVLMFYSVVV